MVCYMDANEDVRKGRVADMFKDLRMKEQITTTHGHYSHPPATHDSNTNNVPIDGIWTNFEDPGIRCGYLPFGEGIPGDHRTPFLDIPFQSVFGYNPPHLHTVYPPKLTTRDPRERKKYSKQVMK